MSLLCAKCGATIHAIPESLTVYSLPDLAMALGVHLETLRRRVNELDRQGKLGLKLGRGQYPISERVLSPADAKVVMEWFIRPLRTKLRTKAEQAERKAAKAAQRAEVVKAAPVVELDDPVRDKGVTADWRERVSP